MEKVWIYNVSFKHSINVVIIIIATANFLFFLLTIVSLAILLLLLLLLLPHKSDLLLVAPPLVARPAVQDPHRHVLHAERLEGGANSIKYYSVWSISHLKSLGCVLDNNCAHVWAGLAVVLDDLQISDVTR